MSFPVRALASTGVIVAAVLGLTPAAVATEGSVPVGGSVPVEVSAFATDPAGLTASLDDFFGVAADGSGIDFDETTEIGRVDRVFGFTDEWLAGESTDTPVLIANQWTAPVAVDGDPVGVAVIWINPSTVRPQLADFVPAPDFASALADLPADAYLVSDEARGAWFSLSASTLTPLVAGASGVAADTTLARYQDSIIDSAAAPVADEVNLGSVLSVGIIVAVALAVVLMLLIPLARRRRKERTAPDGALP